MMMLLFKPSEFHSEAAAAATAAGKLLENHKNVFSTEGGRLLCPLLIYIVEKKRNIGNCQ